MYVIFYVNQNKAELFNSYNLFMDLWNNVTITQEDGLVTIELDSGEIKFSGVVPVIYK